MLYRAARDDAMAGANGRQSAYLAAGIWVCQASGAPILAKATQLVQTRLGVPEDCYRRNLASAGTRYEMCMTLVTISPSAREMRRQLLLSFIVIQRRSSLR
jgi:hypothetical protein